MEHITNCLVYLDFNSDNIYNPQLQTLNICFSHSNVIVAGASDVYLILIYKYNIRRVIVFFCFVCNNEIVGPCCELFLSFSGDIRHMKYLKALNIKAARAELKFH